MNKDFIIFDSISKVYNDGKDLTVKALSDVNISFSDRGLYFVIGKSGSGKSTLLNILGGMDSPDDGRLIVGGEQIDFNDEDTLNHYRSENIGFVFQDHNLIEDFSVYDNICLPLLSMGKCVEEEKIKKLIEKVELTECQKRLPSSLSGGQRQRAAIVRALAKDPKILLLDEPTGNLDAKSAETIFALLKELSQKLPIIVVTHDKRSAYEYADKIIELDDGKVVKNIYKSSKTEFADVKNQYEDLLTSLYSECSESFVTEASFPIMQERKKDAMHLKNAAFIAFSSLRRRILSTVLFIVTLSLALMGAALSYTVSAFDFNESLSNTLVNNGYKAVAIAKGYIDENSTHTYTGSLFSYDEYLRIKDDLGQSYKILPYTYSFEKYINEDPEDELKEEKPDNILQPFSVLGVCELCETIDEENLDIFYGAKLLYGNYPKLRDDAVEILLSDYLVESLLTYGAVLDNGILYPNTSKEEIIGKTITRNGINFEIVGIYTCDYSPEGEDLVNGDGKIRLSFAREHVFPIALTNYDALEIKAKSSDAYLTTLNVTSGTSDEVRQYSALIVSSNSVEDALKLTDEQNIGYLTAKGYNKNEISDSEICISYQLYCRLFDKFKFNSKGQRLDSFDNLTQEDLNDLKVTLKLSENISRQYNIVCVFEDINGKSDIVLTNEGVKNDIISYSLEISSVLLPVNSSIAKDVVKGYNTAGTLIVCSENIQITRINGLFSVAKSTLTLVTVIIILFIFILMHTIISKNIGESRRNIGIMRTFGVTRKELFKVYFLIDLVYFVFSVIGGMILYSLSLLIVNHLMGVTVGAKLTLLSFNGVAFIIIMIVSFVSILISSLITLIRYTVLKPDEVIRRN